MFRLDPDTFKKLHPHEFHRRFLAHGIRPDGRKGLRAWRTPAIHSGAIDTANGSAMVRLGSTTVLCGIKAEVAVPDPNDPTSGFLVPNVDFPPICSALFKPGAPGEFGQSVSEMLYSIVKGSNILNLESLCIEPGKAVWCLHVDIVFLNYAGNPIDAAFLAFTSALQNLRLPRKTVYNQVDGTISTNDLFDSMGNRVMSDEEVVGLEIERLPLAFTFGIFEVSSLEQELLNVSNGKLSGQSKSVERMAIADPTDEEESVLVSKLTVVIDKKSGDRSVLMGTFGGQVSLELLKDCIYEAKNRAKEITI